MSRPRRRHRSRLGHTAQRSPGRPDPLEDIFESGGELFLAIGYTPGGAPYGPRVEIVDGELGFPDETPADLDYSGGTDENPF